MPICIGGPLDGEEVCTGNRSKVFATSTIYIHTVSSPGAFTEEGVLSGIEHHYYNKIVCICLAGIHKGKTFDLFAYQGISPEDALEILARYHGIPAMEFYQKTAAQVLHDLKTQPRRVSLTDAGV